MFIITYRLNKQKIIYKIKGKPIGSILLFQCKNFDDKNYEKFMY